MIRLKNIFEIKDYFCKYLINLDEGEVRLVESKTKEFGIEVFNNYFLKELDVTIKHYQTIDYRYKYLISGFIYASDILGNPNIESQIERLLELHNNNITHEVNNPPVIYVSKKGRKPKAKEAKDDTDKKAKPKATKTKIKKPVESSSQFSLKVK